MIYIGIDPGKSGAFAAIRGKAFVYPWDENKFVDAMKECAESDENMICCLEKVGAMPGQGVSSMFNFGQNFGFIQGVLSALTIPFQLVPPRRWKAEFGLNADKARSVAVCKRLFPGVSLLPTPRCRKENDGMAEALLMAEYARRKVGGRDGRYSG